MKLHLFGIPLRRMVAGILACICLFSAVGCGAASTKDCAPMDALAVSFDPTVYYARDGRIRFLYDSDTDMMSALDGYDMVSLYAGGVYSMVISYFPGTVERDDADDAIKAEFGAGGPFTLSAKTKSVDVSGHAFRRAEITASDGSAGAVLYGSTDTGFAEIYYILSPDATQDDRVHVEEIIATVELAEFETGYEDDVKIFAQ